MFTTPELEFGFDIWLTTLPAAKRHQGIKDWNDKDEPVLRDAIRQASADILAFLGWLPVPYYTSRTYTKNAVSKLADVLIQTGDLLEIDTLTDANDAAVANAELLPENSYPKNRITFDTATCAWLSQGCPPSRRRYTVSGWWGFVPHFGREWRDSRVDVPDDLSADAEEVTLGSDEGMRFEVGQYLRMEDEIAHVDIIDGDKLTLRRGLLGTTAAAHDAGTDIRIFVQSQLISSNCTEWAVFLYRSREQIGKRVQISEQGTLEVNDLSPEIKKALGRYARR